MCRVIGWLSAVLLTLCIAGPAQARIFLAEKFTDAEDERVLVAIERAVSVYPVLQKVVDNPKLRITLTRNGDVYDALGIFAGNRGFSVPEREDGAPGLLGAHYRNFFDPTDARIVLADALFSGRREADLDWVTAHELVHSLHRWCEYLKIKAIRKGVTPHEEHLMEEIETYTEIERGLMAFVDAPRYQALLNSVSYANTQEVYATGLEVFANASRFQAFLNAEIEPGKRDGYTAGVVWYLTIRAATRQKLQAELDALRR